MLLTYWLILLIFAMYVIVSMLACMDESATPGRKPHALIGFVIRLLALAWAIAMIFPTFRGHLLDAGYALALSLIITHPHALLPKSIRQ